MINANKVREVKEVSKNNNNRTDQKHKADISFIKDGKQQFFDIGISWDTERYFAVKQKHYQTETVNGLLLALQLLSEKIRQIKQHLMIYQISTSIIITIITKMYLKWNKIKYKVKVHKSTQMYLKLTFFKYKQYRKHVQFDSNQKYLTLINAIITLLQVV
ncbi:Hypothetical_protein [Hexamita inflata]|uniref:Hypothetical_protein n=1 Tax=Hexamita inflata TaxID=28002 RepID=A0AA86Q9Q8_9EUKA|nr:Hypothetical protein HINF_LOCUS38993 [Hexamita inflata]